MSTFPGLVQEIPGISIDCFDGDNLNSSAFFLSHCHQDHMKGLKCDFLNQLQSKSQYLYCSHISKSFLKNMFSKCKIDVFDKHVIELPLDESRIIEYIYIGNLVSFTVSCISSGHCPGSVMFLFKFVDKIILYTGDFRIDKRDFSKLKSLHCSGNPLNFDKIYLDTTFLNLDFYTLPSRLSSSEQLCGAVKNWLEKSSKNIVLLEISALYGSEYIYIELFKLLNKKIHVKDKTYEIYSKMEILADCITNISENTSIHACMNKIDSIRNVEGLKCRSNVDMKNILTIVPSVQKWAGKDTTKIVEWDTNRKQTLNICYSTHSSYDELVNFIQYFKPKKVFPCVCNENNKTKIYNLLQNIMKKNQTNEMCTETSALSISKYKICNFNDCKSQLISDEEDN